MKPASRLMALDVLRAVAVLLVLGRHMVPLPSDASPAWVDALLQAWKRGGWIGVDLFFVLSGFLVAGLLFREHQRHGKIQIGRFLLRRGFKIYPAFYAFIAVTVLVYALGFRPITWEVARGATLGELLFLQNYAGHLWGHTWSLAIEEHFYLLLPLLLVSVAAAEVNAADPFRRIPRLFLLSAAGFLGLRIVNALLRPQYTEATHLFPTHLRLDALMCGVWLAYLFHYHRQRLETFCRGRGPLLIPAGMVLMLPAFIFPLSTWGIYTVGLTSFYLGSAIWVAFAATSGIADNPATRVLAYIGRHSYSIYLWHAMFLEWGIGTFGPALRSAWGPWAELAVYLAGCIGLGIGLAQLIEMPMVRLRDRLFPSSSESRKIGEDSSRNVHLPGLTCRDAELSFQCSGNDS